MAREALDMDQFQRRLSRQNDRFLVSTNHLFGLE